MFLRREALWGQLKVLNSSLLSSKGELEEASSFGIIVASVEGRSFWVKPG